MKNSQLIILSEFNLTRKINNEQLLKIRLELVGVNKQLNLKWVFDREIQTEIYSGYLLDIYLKEYIHFPKHQEYFNELPLDSQALEEVNYRA